VQTIFNHRLTNYHSVCNSHNLARKVLYEILKKMKVVSLIAVAGVASTSAFVAPMSNGRVATPLFAEKKPTFFDTVFGMDLFAPNKQVNDYGSRGKKNVGSCTVLKVLKPNSSSTLTNQFHFF
jgi:hypothetical protein